MSIEQRQKARNEKLFGLLEELAISFLDALDKPFFSDYGSWYDRVRPLFKGDAELVAKILELRPDLEEKKLSRCILSSQKALEGLQNENICRNKPHASSKEDYQEELAFFLQRLFKLRENARMEFAEEGLKLHINRLILETYLKYEDYLYDPSASDFIIGPIENLILSKNIEFDKQAIIRKITQHEFHSIVEAEEDQGQKLASYPEFVVCIPACEGKWPELLKRIITSMRLLKNSRIGLTHIYYAYSLPFRPWKLEETLEGLRYSEKSTGAFLRIDSNEELELKKLFAFLTKSENVGYLAVSIRRFNFAYGRERLEDSWVDLFISLESLFSTSSESTEVTHRLATRVSRALTSGSLEDKKQIRNKVKGWYSVRSRIVHGQKVELDQGQLEDLENTLRKSLTLFLAHADYENHDKIIDLLDLN